MKISHLIIRNFRGIKEGKITLEAHSVLIGDNNIGKTTVLEAIDLVLGPDRLNRMPPINEHDFYQGKYFTALATVDKNATGAPPVAPISPQPTHNEGETDNQTVEVESPRIEIEVNIIDLTEEQKARFGDYIEFWDMKTGEYYDKPNPAGIDVQSITEAFRVTFRGWYDPEEDDFQGKTYFTRSLLDGGSPVPFSKRDKQVCGFLFLRSIRTGSRALSLERGSLLDIILRLKEVRPQMWEQSIIELTKFSVTNDSEFGLSGVLKSINQFLKKYVPKEWGIEPHLKVSSLTREHLRKIITAFMATGEGLHSAPFYLQGRGTINMLVLAMLSQIAQDKQNVIFAMEEPETAIPPYAQKRIVHEIRKLASQTLFTSHSPYVLEEFSLNETVVFDRNDHGVLSRRIIDLPNSVKLKRYRQEFRTRFCEGLLARRVLIAEGATEATAFPVVCRRLAELNPETYSSLEALGICTIDAGGETNIPDVAKFYRDLGKQTFAFCDKQETDNIALIDKQVELKLMHGEDGFEDLILKHSKKEALIRFAKLIDWPQHLISKYVEPEIQFREALKEYFGWTKNNGGIADFLAQCDEAEMPPWIQKACLSLQEACGIFPQSDISSGTTGDTTEGALADTREKMG